MNCRQAVLTATFAAASAAIFSSIPSRSSYAEGFPVQVLRCGEVVTQELAAGETHRYVPGAGPTSGIVTVTDLDGTIGAFRGHAHGDVFGSDPVCGDDFYFGLSEVIDISACNGGATGGYAIALSPFPSSRLCGQRRCDCAVVLECGKVAEGALSVAGQVDSYVFPQVPGGQVHVSVTDPNNPEARFRIRKLTPNTPTTELCGNSFDFTLSLQGGGFTEALLISACDSSAPGAYQVQLDISPSCSGVTPTPSAMPTPSPEPQPLPLQDSLYILMGGTGTIDLIPRATNDVETSIRLQNNSLVALHASADGAFVYVPESLSSTIAAIDTASNTISALAWSPALHTTMALHPSGRFLYVPAFSFCGVGVIETAAMQVVDVLPVEGFFGPEDDFNSYTLRAIGVRPDGRFLYLSGPGRFGIFDLVSKEMADVIEDPRILLDAAMHVHPSGELAYMFPVVNPAATGARLGTVLVVDLAEHSVRSELPVGAIDLDFSADGSRVYVPSAGGVAVFDTTTDAQVDFIDLPGILPGGIAVSPTSGQLYVTNLHGSADDVAGLVVVDPVSHGFFKVFLAGRLPIDVVVLKSPTGLCVGDEERESKVTIGELITSVNYALDGCPNVTQSPP